jgi:acyl carrier protein
MVDDLHEGELRSIEAVLFDFLRRQLLRPGTEVGREDDLLSGELLDSIAVVRLGTFVEDTFRITIQPADFVIENFRNVAVLAGYVHHRGGKASAAWP